MVKPMSPNGSDIWVLCDFDGTTSVHDVQNMLLDHFIGENWREEVKAALAQGKKSSEYMPRIYKDWPATKEEMIRVIDEKADIAPHFPEFVEYCYDKGYHLEIVSDGLDIYINHLLAKYKLDFIPFTSNRLIFTDGNAEIESPFRSDFCGLCGNCKKQRVMAAGKANAKCVVYLGDGISDECPAAISDIVFAKGGLLAYCQRHEIPAIPFVDFSDVLEALPQALEEHLLSVKR
jgi:2-hydroxy-3-keto-5-methylthiopentenyl-1-phosphate phosphatase